MNWIYQGKSLKEPPDGYWGFIYIITNLDSGRRYLGKKFFTQAGYKQVKKKRKKLRKPSDWLEYYGSNAELLADVGKLGKRRFKREIIRLCKTKSECTYCETFYIFKYGCLLSNDWYNQWVSCKVSKKNIIGIECPS